MAVGAPAQRAPTTMASYIGRFLQALAHARHYRERGHEAWSLFLLGEIDANGRRAQPAINAYQQALRIAETLGMQPLQALCHERLRNSLHVLSR